MYSLLILIKNMLNNRQICLFPPALLGLSKEIIGIILYLLYDAVNYYIKIKPNNEVILKKGLQLLQGTVNIFIMDRSYLLIDFNELISCSIIMTSEIGENEHHNTQELAMF